MLDIRVLKLKIELERSYKELKLELKQGKYSVRH